MRMRVEFLPDFAWNNHPTGTLAILFSVFCHMEPCNPNIFFHISSSSALSSSKKSLPSTPGAVSALPGARAAMGCSSSSSATTIPEANVQKQRRRLSVGNVDTSEVHELEEKTTQEDRGRSEGGWIWGGVGRR